MWDWISGAWDGASNAVSSIGGLFSGGGSDGQGTWGTIGDIGGSISGMFSGGSTPSSGSSGGNFNFPSIDTSTSGFGGSSSGGGLNIGGFSSNTSGLNLNNMGSYYGSGGASSSSIASNPFGTAGGGSGNSSSSGGFMDSIMSMFGIGDNNEGGQQQGTSGGFGQLLSSVGELYGQNQYANQIGSLADKYSNQADPFGQYRGAYAQRMNNLYANPQSFQADPGYQFRRDQGMEALYRTANTYGLGQSGNTMMEAMNYNQGLASQEYGNVWERLATLSGANQAPAQGANIGFGFGQTAADADRGTQGAAGGLVKSLGDIF